VHELVLQIVELALLLSWFLLRWVQLAF